MAEKLHYDQDDDKLEQDLSCKHRIAFPCPSAFCTKKNSTRKKERLVLAGRPEEMLDQAYEIAFSCVQAAPAALASVKVASSKAARAAMTVSANGSWSARRKGVCSLSRSAAAAAQSL